MIPGIAGLQDLAGASEPAKKMLAAFMSALTSSCECEACKILRGMAQDLKTDLLR